MWFGWVSIPKRKLNESCRVVSTPFSRKMVTNNCIVNAILIEIVNFTSKSWKDSFSLLSLRFMHLVPIFWRWICLTFSCLFRGVLFGFLFILRKHFLGSFLWKIQEGTKIHFVCCFWGSFLANMPRIFNTIWEGFLYYVLIWIFR